MIWNIAWRNVWRNKKRSAVILMAVAFGLWAGVVSGGISWGAVDQMVAAAVDVRTAHIQIHQPGFRQYKQIGDVIPNGYAVLDSVRSQPGVQAAVGRVVVSGMITSPRTASGVVMMGIVPDQERSVSKLAERVVKGDFFGTSIRNPILISTRLAQKLKVKSGDKIVLTAQGADGSLAGGAFRIVGLFKTISSQYDKTTVFALRDDIERTFGVGNNLHEIAIMLKDPRDVDAAEARFKAEFLSLDVATWKELEPEMGLSIGMTEQWVMIFIVIILLALVFGITNTMLMGVLERIREFGVIIALGMSHARIFLMILLETIFLSLLGAIAGILIGVGTIAILNHTGINLSAFESGFEAFGISSIIYPSLPLREYPIITVLVILSAIGASIYPGLKAVRLNPVNAIRTY